MLSELDARKVDTVTTGGQVTEQAALQRIGEIDAKLEVLRQERHRLTRRKLADAGLRLLEHKHAAYFADAERDLSVVAERIRDLEGQREALHAAAGYLAATQIGSREATIPGALESHLARIQREYGDLSDLVAEHHQREAEERSNRSGAAS